MGFIEKFPLTADMNKRIYYFIFYIVIAVLVNIMVIYYYTRRAWVPCVTGRPCTYEDVVDLRVVVITFNRADSLTKLLRSLDTLLLDGHRAALEIWIDRDRNKNGVDQPTLELASSFNWKGGPTRVHLQVQY